MAGWQSSSLVIRDPSRAGFETCLLCFQADQRELDRLKEEASRAQEDGDDPAAAEERVNAVQRRMDAAWWRTAVWYARRKHISQCTLQTEENRARAQELLDRNAQSNRRAEQKRKGKEKEKAAVTNASIPSLTSSSNEGPGPSYYYKDYVAPILLEENGEGLSMDTSTRSENAMGDRHYATSDSGSKGHHHSNTAMETKKNKCWTTMVQTRSRASATQPAPHSSSSSSSSTPLPPAASLTLIPPSPPNTVTTTTRPRPRSLPPLQPVKIKLTPAPDDDNNSFNTPTTSSPSTSIHGNTSLSLPSTSARLLSAPLTTDDDASDDNNNLDDEEDDEDGDEDDDNNSMMEGGAVGDDSTNGDLGYPSKLPFWVSANLVVRHPSSKDKETCLACMQELKDQRAELDSERDRESDDWRARSFALDEKIKDAYWLTNGNGRFRHMSECTHQTQDTREKAKVRLDRYLAMARQRMKARHQREKLEKKKRLASTGLTVNTGKAGSGANGQSGRQSSAERVTPEPHAKVRKSMNPKKVAAMAMNEDLRALSIMPGRKREAAIKGKASVMNTYENDFTDDDGDLADMPPPMLHDSGSERSPSVPPEPVKTPHSVSFRVTDEPYIYIKDSLHSLHPSLLNRDEHSSFFAASATLYASQGDSSKITAQTFFDTPSEHTSSLGSRKRSPHHLYSRREESKRRRVTPDVPKRAFAPPRSIKRPNEQSSA